MRSCPKCHKGLEVVTVRGVSVDACPVCAGVWFDAGELQQLKSSGAESWLDLESRIAPRSEIPEAVVDWQRKTCPQCAIPMEPYRFLYHSDITLDECSQCGGIWVDDHELAAMAEFLERTEQERAALPKGDLTPEEMDRVANVIRARRAARGLGGMINMLRLIEPRPGGG